MKRLLIIAALFLPVFAQPKIGSIEIFGNRRVPLELIRATLAVRPGDPLPKSKGAVEERLAALAGVAAARLEAFCCDGSNAVLYVGIQDAGSFAPRFHDEPEKDLSLPPDILSAYAEFTAARARATAEHDLTEEYSAGYPLMRNITCRLIQQRFVALSEMHSNEVRNVLANAADAGQRAAAALLVGYIPAKAEVVDDLRFALEDPDHSVRAAAAHSLKAIAYFAARNPDKGIELDPAWFIDLLNSIELSDRLEAAGALAQISEKRDEKLLKTLRERAILSLLEMSKWQYTPHAYPAFLLAGRMAGWTEQDLQAAWTGSGRAKALASIDRMLRFQKSP
jgi:hypothetical protein